MKKITLLLTILTFAFGSAQVPTIDFETDGASYITAAGSGTTRAIVTGSGTNTTQVAQLNNTGDQYENYVINLDNAVSFANAAKRVISVDFYNSTNTSHLVWVKFEGPDVPPVLVDATSDAVAGWETLTFDFATDAIIQNGCYCTPLVPVTGTYDTMFIFVDGGLNIASTTAIDNIGGGENGGALVPAITSLYLDFETATSFVGGDNAVYTELVTNTVTDGINPSANVAQLDDINIGLYSNAKLSVPEKIDLSAMDKGFSMKVKGPRAISNILLKLEGGTESQQSQAYTTPGVWQELTFDFSSQVSSNNSLIVIFFDFEAAPTTPADDIVQFDDFRFDTLTTLSTNDVELANVALYPNPTQDNWTIKTQNTRMSSIEVYDILGKNVMSLRPDSSEVTVDGSNLRSGLYFAQIKTANGINSIKLIKN